MTAVCTRRFPYRRWLQAPARTVGRIASSDVPCASSCPRPRATSVGDEEDAAADAEHPREDAGGDAEHDREGDGRRAHDASSQIAIAVSSTANP